MEAIREFSADHPLVWKLVLVLATFLVASIVVRLMQVALDRAYWRRFTAVLPTPQADVALSRRRQTIRTVLASLTRYTVYGAALVIALGIATDGAAGAFFGASVVAVVIGFGLQRLLTDVVAGVLLLFEGHFEVGDFVVVNAQNQIVGLVEDFSLRTTTLRSLNGDRVVVLNGAIQSFVTVPGGYRTFRIDLVVSDEQRARAAFASVCSRLANLEALFIAPPEIEQVETLPAEAGVSLRVRALVIPTGEWLAEQVLSDMLAEELGEVLVGRVPAYNVDADMLTRFRAMSQPQAAPLIVS